MRNKYRILKIIVTVIALSFLLRFSMQRFDSAPIREIVVNIVQEREPVSFINEKEVKTLVAESTPTKKLGDIDIPRLERTLKGISAVDSANVFLNLNGSLHLDIIQKIPIFRIAKSNGQDVYIDAKGQEFPIQKNYAYPCMLVSGDISAEEYPALLALVDKINQDDFSRKFFVGITKYKKDYYLMTNDMHYKVELGELEDIDFKIKGFKTFVEKYLVYQPIGKYKKISLKYKNQIVATLKHNKTQNNNEEKK